MDSPGELLRGLEELTRTDFQDLRDWYFNWLLISSFLVFIGVLMEAPDLIQETREWLRKLRPRSLSLDTATGLPVTDAQPPRSLIRIASLAGWLIVLIGVIGEGIFEGFVSRSDALLQTFEATALGQTQKETAIALERAADANREAEELRIKLANSSIPRSLEEDAQKRVAAKLPRRSTGGQVNVMYLPWTFDGLSLARQILGALARAGIFIGPQEDITSSEDRLGTNGIVANGFASAPLRVFTGIQVMHTSDPRSKAYASALAGALNDEHLDAVLLPGLTISPMAGEELKVKVTIRIGRKP